MPRRPRYDAPNSIHHVFGRAIARRTMFESRQDIRYFQALLVREVRAGRIQILAYSFLTTHYHLVVRSLSGELSKAMMHVLNRYVRYFNRLRRRDGTLLRGRFGSRPVLSSRYFRVLIRYIDLNAPQARLVRTPGEYPYGSARHYTAARRPRWLHTDDIDGRLGSPPPAERARLYVAAFGGPLSAAERAIVHTRITRAPSGKDELDSLIGAAPPAVREWMRRKAKLADNTKPGVSYAAAQSIISSVRAEQLVQPELLVRSPAGLQVKGWPTLEVGLLRDLGGLTLAEICLRGPPGATAVRRRIEEHRRLMFADEGYAQVVALVARRALDLQWGCGEDAA